MANQKLKEIKNFFNIEKLWHDKRVVVFVACLLISSILWFLNALSKDYNTTITYPVKFVNIPENKFLANNPPSSFELIVDAHGFALLRNKLNLSFTPIVLDIKKILVNSESDDGKTYRFNSSNIVNRISSQVSNEISILEVRPTSFILILDNLESRKVKVKPDVDIKFESQYNISSGIIIEPDSVTVTGPGSIIDTIQNILTKPYKADRVKKSISAELNLTPPENITVTPEKVKLNANIEEFTEKKLAIPITVKEKPDDVTIRLFPSEVQVSFMVGISRYTEITSNNFEAVINYSEIVESQNNLNVTIEKKPDFISEMKFSPQAVEYLIEKE